jgi:sec-independent protein translocase protein TatA
MFGSIGGPELIVIFVVALLIFGPRKLPELGRMLGKGLSEFRRAANDLRDSLETEVARDQAQRREMTADAPARTVPVTTPAPGIPPPGADPGPGAAMDPVPTADAAATAHDATKPT